MKRNFILATVALLLFSFGIFFVIAESLVKPGDQNVQINHTKSDKNAEMLKLENLKPEKIRIDGKSGWKIELPGKRSLATPALIDGKLFIGGGFGSYEFYSFNAKTGEPVWAERVFDDGPTAAVVKDRYVVFNTESCTIFTVDKNTGKIIWSKWLGDPLMSQPAIYENMVFMAYPGSKGHMLCAMDISSGKEFWSVPIAGDIISSPVIYKDYVYLSTFDGTVYCYDSNNGREKWKREMNATSAPWIFEDQIFVSRREKNKDENKEGIALLDKDSGEQKNKTLWAERRAEYLNGSVQDKTSYNKEQKKDDSSVGFSTGPSTAKLDRAYENIGQGTVRGLWEFQGSRPVYHDGRVYSVLGDAIVCVETKTEKVIWEKKIDGELEKLGGHLASPPSLAGDKIYIGTTTGWLMVYNIKDGSISWKVNIGESIRYQPAISNGWVYIGTTGGSIFAIDANDASATGWNMWGGSAGHNGSEK